MTPKTDIEKKWCGKSHSDVCCSDNEKCGFYDTSTDTEKGWEERFEYIYKRYIASDIFPLLKVFFKEELLQAKQEAYFEGLNENWGGDREIQLKHAKDEAYEEAAKAVEEPLGELVEPGAVIATKNAAQIIRTLKSQQ